MERVVLPSIHVCLLFERAFCFVSIIYININNNNCETFDQMFSSINLRLYSTRIFFMIYYEYSSMIKINFRMDLLQIFRRSL